MDRRAFLAAALAVAAGCGSSGGGGARTIAPNLRGTPPPSPTPTPTATPPASATAGPGDGGRAIALANLTHRETAVQIVAGDGNDRTDFETSRTLEAGETVRPGGTFRPGVHYDVSVVTDEGLARTIGWDVTEEGGDLRVGIGRDLVVREAHDAGRSTAFVTSHTGIVRDAPDEGWAPLVVDNPGEAATVRIGLSAGGGLGGLTLAAPARSHLLLPLTVPERRVDVSAVRDEDRATTTWRPLVDGALHLTLDGPRFTCDPLYRDLRVENGADRERTAQVTVLTDGGTVVVGTATVAPGESRTRRAAVPPAERYVVRVDTDGVASTYALPRCPPVGPLVVTLRPGGVRVTGRAVDAASPTVVTGTATETDDVERTGTVPGG